MNKLTLGAGWFDQPLMEGEGFEGSKYADLGIYYNGVNILPLSLDHYGVTLDGQLGPEMLENLQKAIAEINTKL